MCIRDRLLSASNLDATPLMDHLEAIVIERIDGASWELYTNTSNDDWKDIGLPTPPMRRDDDSAADINDDA